jgi:hypothetical protein
MLVTIYFEIPFNSNNTWAQDKLVTSIESGSVIHACLHSPHPTQVSALMLGRSFSQQSVSGTGQLPRQAPHSGPE